MPQCVVKGRSPTGTGVGLMFSKVEFPIQVSVQGLIWVRSHPVPNHYVCQMLPNAVYDNGPVGLKLSVLCRGPLPVPRGAHGTGATIFPFAEG